MNELDLSALIVSRVCHDLISPVGALANGVEVLADDDDPEMRTHAIALIQKSAEQAAAKLKLCRLAYGSMGSAGETVSLHEARDALEGLLKDGKTRLQWDAPAVVIAKDVVKLAVNLGLVALEAIPRGGVLRVWAEEGDGGFTLAARAEGPMARLQDELKAALAGEAGLDALDGRRVQPFFAGLVARGLGAAIEATIDGTGVSFRAALPASVRAAA